MPGVIFLDKFVKIASALEALPQDPLVSGVWGFTPNSCLLLLYTITTFHKAKILFDPGAGYASYATDCG